MFTGQNLKILRKRLGQSQEETASALGLTRSSYSGYENGVAQPSVENLMAFSDYFQLSIDDLVRKDFSKLTEDAVKEIIDGPLADTSGKHLRILTSMVDSNDEELIEMIPMQASAGYANGYADPEYLKVLPTFHLPFLSKNKKYRSFPIKGDSMPPVVEGSYVVGEFIQNWMTIRNGTPCIVVTKEDGIVFKVVNNLLTNNESFQLCSTNTFYAPYEVKANSILEIWKFVNYISPELPDVQMDQSGLTQSVQALQREVHDLKIQLRN